MSYKNPLENIMNFWEKRFKDKIPEVKDLLKCLKERPRTNSIYETFMEALLEHEWDQNVEGYCVSEKVLWVNLYFQRSSTSPIESNMYPVSPKSRFQQQVEDLHGSFLNNYTETMNKLYKNGITFHSLISLTKWFNYKTYSIFYAASKLDDSVIKEIEEIMPDVIVIAENTEKSVADRLNLNNVEGFSNYRGWLGGSDLYVLGAIGCDEYPFRNTGIIPLIFRPYFFSDPNWANCFIAFNQDEFLKVKGKKRLIEHICKKIYDLRVNVESFFQNLPSREVITQEFIGTTPAVMEIKEMIKKIATVDSTVLLLGGTGTGKEVVAREIYNHSSRRNNSFIKCDVGSLPETLTESELFGHERGAFTGAERRKRGRFELANKGTIFIDEIGNISPNIQAKLLRVLQDKEFERVGGEETIQVDVRIIAATNKDLEKEIKEQRFREDLYYRLNVVPIHLPPLRERKEDIPLLVKHFIEKLGPKIQKKITSVSTDAMDVLKNYKWPGNIRELENAIERAMIFAQTEEITLLDLPSTISGLTTK